MEVVDEKTWANEQIQGDFCSQPSHKPRRMIHSKCMVLLVAIKNSMFFRLLILVVEVNVKIFV